MRLKSLFSLAAIALLSLVVLTPAAHAGAVDTTFYFSGSCQDCSGHGYAELTVLNYTPGDDLSADNFVSFSYSGTNLLPSFQIATVDQLSGILYDTTGVYGVFLSGYDTSSVGTIFSSNPDGFWCVGSSCVADYGFAHTWGLTAPDVSATPEPASFALVGTGLTALIGLRRRFVRA